MSSESVDIARLVIRTGEFGSDRYRYFLVRRTKDQYWEWVGGKREEEETIEEAAVRELKEGIRIEWNEDDYEVVDIADKYQSEDYPKYKLHPVLIELERTDFSEENLSEKYDRINWIELDEYDEYETLGQLEALRKLDLVQGDAVVGAVKCPDRGFLAVRRSENETMTGKWEFTGGGVEQDDESLEEAVLREVEEESGLDVELVKKGDVYIGEGSTGFWILHPFLLETDLNQEVELCEEHDRFNWIEIKDFIDLETVGKFKAIKNLGLK